MNWICKLRIQAKTCIQSKKRFISENKNIRASVVCKISQANIIACSILNLTDAVDLPLRLQKNSFPTGRDGFSTRPCFPHA